MKVIAVAGAALLATSCGKQSNQNTQIVPASDVTREFIGTCVKTLADPAKITSLMKISKSVIVTDPDVLRLAAPEAPSPDMQMWLHKIAGHSVFVTTNSGLLKGRTIRVCTLAFKGGNIDDVVNDMASVTKAKKIDDSVENGQRYRMYELNEGDHHVMINVTDGTPIGTMTGSVSAMVL